jgi:23S rRNA (cytidine1920-2'-O)/16S rRNA (cytidine1409-2'-O)-methyltransferase
MARKDECPYVSRGGLKLAHALVEFDIDVTGKRCADLGCSTGGFTDCLLKHGALRVMSLDTAYNIIDFSLRRDSRVHVRERENALHAEPGEDGGCDLVVVDIGWTAQRLALPAAARWLGDGVDTEKKGRIISLIKPHYEAGREVLEAHAVQGVLPEELAEQICQDVVREIGTLGFVVEGVTRSPIAGGKGKRAGNTEWLALIARSG